MTTRRGLSTLGLLGLIVFGGCEDPVGTTVPQRDMFVRQITDMAAMTDTLRLDGAMVIRECEAGETRSCGTAVGECLEGLQVCSENGLWNGPCMGSVDPIDELCDEKDNDCDGLTDEVFTLGGTCKYTDDRGFDRDGRVYCNLDEADPEYGMPYCRPEIDCNIDEDGDGVGVCDDCDDGNAINFPGNVERCDSVDNDCDERIDETFDLDAACQVGQGICRVGGETVCAANEMETTCVGEPGDAADEICDGLDNDCDGLQDEGFNLDGMCTVGQGVCQAAGAIICNADGTAGCNAQAGMPGAETCNELDDDCDGVVDEELGLGDVCSVGRGICQRDGENRCNPDGTGEVVCSVQEGEPLEAESCNALDDDCDGVVDEGNPDGGADCDSGNPGRCGPGIVTCVQGGLICVPQANGIAEVCNGVDDDCDQRIDEVPGVGEPCSAGVGLCQTNGTQICEIGVGVVCSATAGQPNAEVCNNQDDDCDGRTDEGNPGAGAACETGELGRCLIGSLTCADGALQCVRSSEPIDEFCNNDDDDCDGIIDEVPGVGEDCSAGIGACRRVGQRVCSNGGGLVCSATAGSPGAERCDDVDNDCDGRVDETFNLRQPCTVGVGTCEVAGQMVCAADGLDVECQGIPGPPTIELCDGLDNDCDGTSDEGNPESGGNCNTEFDGLCQAGIRNCRNAVLVCDRVNEPAVELCDGLDNDCDGRVDETFPLGNPCTEGVGACSEDGQLVCNDAQDGTQCSVTAGVPQNEFCDAIDNDCDGRTDEGYGVGDDCSVGEGRCRQNGRTVCLEDGTAGCDAVPGEPREEVCNAVPPVDDNFSRYDDDCDGLIDEGNPGGGAVELIPGAQGVCNIGIRTCVDGELVLVPRFTPGELQEVCDSIDNDCDGQEDEGNPGAGQVCEMGLPGTCNAGTTRCNGQISCFQNTPSSPETCDELDNDCDGTADEGFGLGDPCDGDDADQCTNGTVACDLETGGTVCIGDAVVEETCNDRDDDCDGIVDNGFDKLNDVTNCGSCGTDCRDPDPFNPGQELPNASCISGTCFQTFYVDDRNGSNSTGDGTEGNPWRTMSHALDGRIDSTQYAARIYVKPGRYSSDQWVDLQQCDGDGDGDPSNDSCATHTIACETNGDPRTIERCAECVCSPELQCAGGLCSMPESEREDLPIRMQDKVQLVGDGSIDHVVIDGGMLACFLTELHPDCDILRKPDGGQLVRAENMDDQPMMARGRTCYTLDDVRCMQPGDPNYLFLSRQPRWGAHGSRNLLSNMTLLRGSNTRNRIGTEEPTLFVTTLNNGVFEAPRQTNLRISNLKIVKSRADTEYPVAVFGNSNILLEDTLVESCEGRGPRGLVLATTQRNGGAISSTVIDRVTFQNNDVGDAPGSVRALVHTSTQLTLQNTVFSNNTGGGLYLQANGKALVNYNSFSRNSYYHIYVHQNVNKSVIIANNLFAKETNDTYLFVHSQAEQDTFIYNNIFDDDDPLVRTDRSGYGTAERLNGRSFASDNVQINLNLVNAESNNLALRPGSPAIDAGQLTPVPDPRPVTLSAAQCVDNADCQCVGNDCICINDDGCTTANARDSKWNLNADICNQDGLCEVDTVTDTDNDGAPDWIELILLGDEHFITETPDTIVYDTPYSVHPAYDLNSFLRPEGAASDQGAIEWAPPGD
ncbi:MAG: MopE-related protein [Myxococcota bacterium]|nr:MopE-related protein [Myxococcota bacterium]